MTRPTDTSNAGSAPSRPANVAQNDHAIQSSTSLHHGQTDTTLRTATAPSDISTSAIPGMTGAIGEAGLPPSRPSSIATSGTRRGSQIMPLGRGGIGSAGTPSLAGSMGPQSRPTTASRTHVPLAAHGFFRPMSSQRLQQQRGQRPASTLGQTLLTSEGVNDVVGRNYRNSIGSVKTIRERQESHKDLDLPPPSRGTDTTEPDWPDRTTANSTPLRPGTIRSRGDSNAPLQRLEPDRQDLNSSNEHNKSDQNSPPILSKSPRSFNANFIRPTRESRSSHIRTTQGHEKLVSAESSPRMVKDKPTLEIVKTELGKNYQYFSGNTVFCWGGRLQNTRDRPINIVTTLLIVLPCTLFFGFSAPWLWIHSSPSIPIIFAYTFVLCLSSLIHATASDPGILPRNLHPFPNSNLEDDPLNVGPSTTEWTMVLSSQGANTAMEVPTKYCKTCNIWRPPRTHHCRVCDNCIETQDHHCVWLNNCIGRRNYRYFFTFVCSGTLLGILLLAFSLVHILVWLRQNEASFGTAINEWRVPFAMCIYALLITPYPLSLGLYHMFLMARGETTREYLNSHKFLKKDRHRPFAQRSWIRNWAAVLLRPRPPTFLHFKQHYAEGDQRFGPRRSKRTAPLTDEEQGGGLEMKNVLSSSQGFQGPTSILPRSPIGDVESKAAN